MEAQAMIANLLKRMDGNISGRVQLQKLFYFCKVFGVDVNANFRLYIYGPFSQQVADSLQDGVMDELFEESSGHICEGTNFDSYFASLSDADCLSEAQQEIVNDVISTFGDMKVKDLEIIATTFFIDQQQKNLFASDNKDEVLKKVQSAKGSRFTWDDIKKSYADMQEYCLPIMERHVSTVQVM